MNNQKTTKMTLSRQETFVISHSFEADIKTVFEMWINPDHFSSWLGPEGADMTFLSAGVKEGGTSQWEMTTGDGQTKYGQINFKIINLNHLLVYTQNFLRQRLFAILQTERKKQGCLIFLLRGI